MTKMKCCICNKKITEFESNIPDPYPKELFVNDSEFCCTDCNELVLKARLNKEYLSELQRKALNVTRKKQLLRLSKL
jgi:hypothetical protein